MKQIYNIGWLLGGLMLLAGCDISNRDNNLSEPLVYFINSGETTVNLYNTGEDYVYDLPIFKSGLIEKRADIELTIDENLLKQYNEENKKIAEILPAKYYQINKKEGIMETSQKNANFQVTFRTSLLDEDPNKENYILPISLLSKGEVQVNPQKASAIITPAIQMTTFGFTCGENQTRIIENNSIEELEITLPIETCFPNKWNIEFTADATPALLDEWNTTNSTAYQLMPENSYQLTGEAKLAAGIDKQNLKLIVNAEKLPVGWSAIPIRLSNPSQFTIAEEQSICYVTVLKRLPGRLDRTGWTVYSESSHQGSDEAKKMIDGLPNTMWHSKWSGISLPQVIIFKLSKVSEFTEFEILRRSDQYNTDLKAGTFEVSMDGTKWQKIADFDFGKDKTDDFVSFYSIPVKGIYLKISITESNRVTNVSICELNAHGFANN